jgi:hypothetical protein
MRAREFMREDASAGATVAGSIAPVIQPLGSMISRQGLGGPAKYVNSFKPQKKRKRHASR